MAKTDMILQTKLQPPRIKEKILLRERLLDLLEDNLERKFILISADAGYGKTTLLAQLCSELKSPFIFYHVTNSDNDLISFFRYISSGMGRIYPGFGQKIKEVIPQTRNIEIIVGTFINEFVAKVKKEFFIILDDYHHIQHNREIANALDYLLRHAPDNFHLVISSRTTPALNLDYYLASQDLYRLEKEQLRFNSEELKTLLKDVYNLKIHDELIFTIEKHSEGWITAIQLILQKIYAMGDKGASDTLNNYLTSGEDIFNYFAREVFEGRPKRIRDFLMHTAILDYLSPEVCDYLLGIKNSERVLRYLEIEHIFISKINDKYKHHPLFHDFLIKRLMVYYPSKKIKRLYYKLANYFLKRGDYATAVSNFIQAEDYPRAAFILEKYFLNWRYAGEYVAFNNLVGRFPETVLEKFPGLLLKKARLLGYLGKVDVAFKVIKPVVKKLQKLYGRKILAEAYFIMGSLYLHLAESCKALNYYKRAGRLTKPNEVQRKIEIFIGMANSHRLRGHYEKTESYLSEALVNARRIHDFNLEVQVLKSLAYLYWAKYNYQKAEELFAEIIARLAGESLHFELGRIYVDAAMVALYNYNLESAERYLEQAKKFAEDFNDCWLNIYQIFARGDLYFSKREYAKALECYQRVQELCREPTEKLFGLAILLSISLTYLMMGKISACQENLKSLERNVRATSYPSYFIQYCIVKGKIENIHKNFPQAFKYFKKAMAISRKRQQPYLEMEICYEMARTHLSNHAPKRARIFLNRSLTIGRANGYDAYFICEGLNDLTLIEFGIKNELNPDYLTKILGRMNSGEARKLLNEINMVKGNYDFNCRLFGDVEIRNNQQQIIEPHWRTKKGKSLFVFMVTNDSKGCPRDLLIETFWPDKKASAAAHSLQVEISSLRNMLREITGNKLDAKNAIRYQNQKYFLSPELVIKNDILSFEELVKKARGLEAIDLLKSRQLLEQALKVYRGDFCSDIVDKWAEDRRIYYKEMRIKILKKLGELCYKEKNFRKSLEYYLPALGFDRYDETIYLGIMRCYNAIGDRDNIQKYYQLLIKTLQQMNITTPAPETLKIYQDSLKT